MGRFTEWERKEIQEAADLVGPEPDVCPVCGGELKEGEGYVGETILYCDNDDCTEGIVWEDAGGAVARVI